MRRRRTARRCPPSLPDCRRPSAPRIRGRPGKRTSRRAAAEFRWVELIPEFPETVMQTVKAPARARLPRAQARKTLGWKPALAPRLEVRPDRRASTLEPLQA